MSIKINTQTVIFKNSPVENVRQDKCVYCHTPFKTIMVTKTIIKVKSLLKLVENILITVLSVNGG